MYKVKSREIGFSYQSSFLPANSFNAFKEFTFFEYKVNGAELVSPIAVKSYPCALHSFSKYALCWNEFKSISPLFKASFGKLYASNTNKS